jgi:hypothetical protein
MIPSLEQGATWARTTTVTVMNRIVKIKERGAKEVISRLAEERMTPTTSVMIMEAGQA